ncbi:MAG: PEP-CTERM sorting domain-containing protein [Pirellula sp.]|nr:PEP-CTERM sorting domain-containing protein [Pirellula sp.]
MSTLKMITLNIVVFAVLLFGASQAYANLILNGSFESSTGGAPDHWGFTGNLAVISSQGETDGSRALAFSFGNLPSNGVLFQSFETTAGAAYKLQFDFGKFSINQPLQVARLEVDVFDGTGFLGANILDQRVTDATPGSGELNSTDSPNVYSRFEFAFSAIGGRSTLRFTDVSDGQVSGGGFDAMLDNVSISAVPEPSSLALVTICSLACSFLVRRSKTKS